VLRVYAPDLGEIDDLKIGGDSRSKRRRSTASRTTPTRRGLAGVGIT
jgi:hypothetical protein